MELARGAWVHCISPHGRSLLRILPVTQPVRGFETFRFLTPAENIRRRVSG